MINNSHQYGQLGDTFYKEMLNLVEEAVVKLEKDSDYKEALSDVDIMKEN